MAGPESSILKIKGTEIQQRITELTVEAIGYYAYPYDRVFGDNEYPVGPDYAAGASGDLFQHAQDLDLRRLERDPAQHHRQGGSGALKAPNIREDNNGFLLHRRADAAAQLGLEISGRQLRLRDVRENRALGYGLEPENWKQFAELGLAGRAFAGRPMAGLAAGRSIR